MFDASNDERLIDLSCLHPSNMNETSETFGVLKEERSIV